MILRIRHFYLLTVLVCATAAAAGPGPTSHIDGTWKLVPAKSDGGPRALPGLLTVRMTTNGAEFEGLQTTENGEVLMKFRSDGKEMVNQLPGGVEMRSRHHVTDGVLFAEYRILTAQGELTQSDRLAVSADGKQLTNDREVKTGQGVYKQKMVFERQ